MSPGVTAGRETQPGLGGGRAQPLFDRSMAGLYSKAGEFSLWLRDSLHGWGIQSLAEGFTPWMGDSFMAEAFIHGWGIHPLVRGFSPRLENSLHG